MRIDDEFLKQYDELDAPGGPRLRVQLIERFLQSAPERIEAVNAAILSGDTKQVFHTAHSLKNIVANVGASDLASLCAVVEDEGQAGRLEQADVLIGEITREYLEVSRELKTRLS